MTSGILGTGRDFHIQKQYAALETDCLTVKVVGGGASPKKMVYGFTRNRTLSQWFWRPVCCQLHHEPISGGTADKQSLTWQPPLHASLHLIAEAKFAYSRS